MHRTSTTNRSQTDNRNETVVRLLFERVYSKGELSHIDDAVTPDFTGESTDSPSIHVGPDGLRSHVLRLRTTFYAFTMEIGELHVQDDTFVVTWTAHGTQERSFQGIAPTITIGRAGEEPHGSPVTVSGVTYGTLRDGRIHESQMVWNVDEWNPESGIPAEDTRLESGTGERIEQSLSLLETPLLGETAVHSAGSRDGGR